MADVKGTIDKTEEVARKIWLAGLGAYGHGFHNLQEGYEKMNDQTRRFFDDLVDRGEKIEADAKSVINKTGDQITDKIKETGEKIVDEAKTVRKEGISLNISDKIEELRDKVTNKLHIPTPFSNEDKIDALTDKMDSLIDAVSKLAEANKPAKTTRKAPARKTTAEKADAKTAKPEAEAANTPKADAS